MAAPYMPAFTASPPPLLSSGGASSCRCIAAAGPHRRVVTMLKVRKSKRAELPGPTTLSGRFLPLDPNDEAVLNALEKVDKDEGVEYGSEGPPSSAYSGAGEPARPRTWNKRAEAAKRRWQDPDYRAKMLAKRQRTKRSRAMEIGAMESITLCDDVRAKQINDYVRSNKLRSEKLTFFHRNPKAWMDARLEEGEALRKATNDADYKRQAQLKRSLEARERHRRKKAREMEADDVDQQLTVMDVDRLMQVE